jgi:hypothetical protein
MKNRIKLLIDVTEKYIYECKDGDIKSLLEDSLLDLKKAGRLLSVSKKDRKATNSFYYKGW